MKSLSFWELLDFAHWANEKLSGAQLQSIWTNGQNHVVLEFHKKQSLYFVVDLNSPSPAAGLFEDTVPIKKKGSKPLTLFLNAHAKNCFFDSLSVDENLGRVLKMVLVSKDVSCFIDWILIPKSSNAIANCGGKVVAWNKPRTLASAVIPEASEFARKGDAWWGFFKDYFWSEAPRAPKAKNEDPAKVIAKKQKALVQLKASLDTNEELQWLKLGQMLLGADPVPPDLVHLYDMSLNRGENRERAFEKGKAIKRKREGTLLRIAELEKEISEIELHGVPERASKFNFGNHEKVKKDSTTKAKRIPMGDFELWIGQSAKDNLALLRKAQPWYYWIHLKDYPGAHGIVARKRAQEVPREFVQSMAERVAQESLKSKDLNFLGNYEVVLAEVRHVRPIKGDKLGRVTYHHPRVFTFASTSVQR